MMRRFSKETKRAIKMAIDVETRHRAELNKQLELYDNRRMMVEMEEMGAGIVITNFGGVDGEVCKSLKERGYTTEKINGVIADIKAGIQHSVWKEKFYRYTFNMDLDEMKKYHDKMTEWWREKDDEVREAIEEGKNICVSVNQEINEGVEDECATKENGYMIHCREMKAGFEERTKFIDAVKGFNL